MQLGNIEGGTIDLNEYGLNPEALKASSKSAGPERMHSLYEKAKSSFEETMSASKLSDAMLEKMLEEFNELAEALDIQLRFTVNKEGPNHINVKVVNIETNEIIREIPPKKFSAVGSKVLDAVGIIVDKMA